MKTYLKNTIKFPSLYSQLVRNSQKQKKFIQDTIAVDLDEAKKENDHTLNGQDFRKITSYYGWAVPAILGESYCVLRGKPMSKSERYGLTCLGASTGLFDDFFDEKDTPEEHIRHLVEHPDDGSANNSHEKLFLKFYMKALQHTDSSRLKYYAFKVYEAQVLSKTQNSRQIEREKIRKITLQKGGASMLYYRCIFDEPIGERENNMLYSIGGLGQLENDIFDVYEDHKNGIKTLATTEMAIYNLRSIYTALMDETFELVYQTNFPIENKRKFLRFFCLIASRGLVCLDRLEEKEALTDHVFSLDAYTRSDLICDMGNMKNLMKLFNYYATQKTER